jgi:uncharacterized membrane protein YdbT with pleckstrin-like domain
MGYIDNLMGRNEKIVFIDRKHWLVLAVRALIDGILTTGILVATVLLTGAQPFLIVLAVLVIIPIADFVVRFLNWYNEQYIITNRRVVEIHGVINKWVSDSSLDKVNDIILEQSILGRLLNYGTVKIITGSDIGVNVFKHMARPVTFKTEMLNQREDLAELDTFRAQTQRVLSEEAPDTGDIPELIAELGELRDKGIITDQEFQTKKAELLGRL